MKFWVKRGLCWPPLHAPPPHPPPLSPNANRRWIRPCRVTDYVYGRSSLDEVIKMPYRIHQTQDMKQNKTRKTGLYFLKWSMQSGYKKYKNHLQNWQNLREPDTLGRFSSLFYKEDNFCDFLFAHQKPSGKKSVIKGKTLLPNHFQTADINNFYSFTEGALIPLSLKLYYKVSTFIKESLSTLSTQCEQRRPSFFLWKLTLGQNNVEQSMETNTGPVRDL